MSILSRPVAAHSVARLMQLGTGLGGRRMAQQAASRLPEFGGRTERIAIPTGLGPIRATLYRPEVSDPTPPVHLNFHGGGFVLALTDMEDPICRALAARAGVAVLNVDNAVAPQHPFPAAAHQVYEVVSWAAANGSAYGWDGGRLTIGGQSAGGNLAAGAARQALEKGGPAIGLQVLHYPPLDLTVAASAKASPIAKPALRPWMGAVFDSCYAPDPATRGDRLVSPAGPADTADLSGIAPAVVVAAAHDILRDEARRYADRLEGVGALVEWIEVSGADHGYDLKDDVRACEIYGKITEHIRQAHSQ